VRELWSRKTSAQIGRLINRSPVAVLQMVAKLGLNRTYGADPQLLDFIRVHHARGMLDTEIVREWQAVYPGRPIVREMVNWYRRVKLGLPVNAKRRQEVRRAAYDRQMAVLGVGSFADLARRRHRRFILQSGWPTDLFPLEVRILDALASGQYMTRREIAASIGCTSANQRDWFKCSGGSYNALGNLVRRGLIKRSQGRNRKCRGKGCTSYEYWIPLDVLRRYRRPGRMLT
jgi:hypothetical protein